MADVVKIPLLRLKEIIPVTEFGGIIFAIGSSGASSCRLGFVGLDGEGLGQINVAIVQKLVQCRLSRGLLLSLRRLLLSLRGLLLSLRRLLLSLRGLLLSLRGLLFLSRGLLQLSLKLKKAFAIRKSWWHCVGSVNTSWLHQEIEGRLLSLEAMPFL